MVRNENVMGGSIGQVISVSKDSIYLLGRVYQRASDGDHASKEPNWWQKPELWQCVSDDRQDVGERGALVEIKPSAHGLVAVFVNLANHMRPEVLQSLHMIAYGHPQPSDLPSGSETFEQLLADEEANRGRSVRGLPWQLLGLLRTESVEVPARLGSTHGDLNLTNVLVTFIGRALSKDSPEPHGALDPRCWLIDYESTRLDGHTGRDYAQLEMGLRREVLVPAYREMCRQLTALSPGITLEQARCLILGYHWAFEEQLVGFDTAPTEEDRIDAEFETVAIADRVLPMIRRLASRSDVTQRIEALASGLDLRADDLHSLRLTRALEDYPKDAIARVVFVYFSTSPVLRRCYSILRGLRNLALEHGHSRAEQLWAQMLVSLNIYRNGLHTEERLASLELEAVLLSGLVAANEIRENLPDTIAEDLSAIEDSPSGTGPEDTATLLADHEEA